MKIVKRIFLVLFILLFLLIGALVAIPYFFKDEIVAIVKEEINNAVNAQVDFSDVDLSLIRSFPDFNMQINNLEVLGIDEFAGLKLAGMDELDLTLDVMSVINSATQPVEIKSVHLVKPEINVLVLKNGKANYDIAKPTEAAETTETTGELRVSLQEYSLQNGKIVYDDQTMPFFMEIDGLNHSGEGDFTLDIFDLTTTTNIDALTVDFDGVQYLKKAKTSLVAGFNIDMPNSKYTLKENELLINALKINADGWVAMPSEDIDMDLTFNAPSTDFKDLLSMIPNAYIAGYEDVKSSGKFNLNGFVKGVYAVSPEQYPAFRIDMDVDNGNVQYPGLPFGIEDIFTNILVDSKTSDLNDMVVDISRFKMKIGNNPIEAKMNLRTIMTDPNVDAFVNGKLDLDELAKAFPMEGVSDLNGIINSDITMKTKYSTIEKEEYEKVDMSGNLGIQNMNYVAEDMPPVKINDLQMAFSPQAVKVSNFDSKLGKSDLKASGSIDNILAYFSPDKTMKGTFTIRSKYFNADEWMTETASSEQSTVDAEATTEEMGSEEELFNRFDFTLDGLIEELDYDVYDIKNIVAKGNFTPNELKINKFGMDIGNSDLAGSGNLTNVWNYVFKDEKLGGNLNLSSAFFDLNQFMTEEEVTTETTTSPEATEPILVPENMDIVVNADMTKVRYDKMDLNNIKGQLLVKNEAVRFENVSANTLGGQMNIEGGYDTKNHEKPRFDFAYDLKNLNFTKAFNALNTIEKIMPIGKFIDGNFNSKFSMSSELGQDLFPDLNTLVADGFLNTINAKLANFKPLQAIGDKLNINEFKNPISIKDTKNWFEVKDGGVEFKEQDYETKGIQMKIGGTHKLTGGMNYAVIAKIPRDKLNKNAIGAAAESGLGFLKKEASKLGFDIDAGEFVNVLINITGSMTDPKLKFKILGSDGEASVQDAITDNIKAEAEKKIEEVKDEVVDKAKLEAEKKAEEVLGKSVADAKDDAKKVADSLANTAAKKVEEELKKKVGDKVGEQGKKEIDKVKDKLKDVKLPKFGKKKKKKEGN
jgi:hypothetical protein